MLMQYLMTISYQSFCTTLKLSFSRTILRYVCLMAWTVCLCLSSVTLLRLTQRVKIYISGFDFDNITAVDVSCCTSLRNFIEIGPPSPKKWRHVDFQDGRSQPSWIL